MSITSRINEMSTHIEQAYDELQGLGADLTNVNKNIENISMVLDDIYDSMPQVSGEGTSLTLDDTRVGKIKSTLKGNTSQTTYSGKNLLNNTLLTTTVTKNGITATPHSDGSITFNGTATALSFFNLSQQDFGENGFNSETGGTGLYVATDGGTLRMAYDPSNHYTYIQVGNGASLNNVIVYPMIRLKTITDNTYEPYVGGTASPNPDYPQDVNVVSGDNEIRVQGKNIAYMKNGTYTYGNNTGVITDNSIMTLNTNGSTGSDSYFSFANGYTRQYAPSGSGIPNINDINLTTNGGTYTATIITNKTMSSSIAIYFWSSTGREIAKRIDGNTTTTLSFDLHDNEHIKDFGIWCAGANVFTNYTIKVQLEKGSSATTYEPYQGNTYNIDLPVENLFDKSTNIISDKGLTTTGGTFDSDTVSIKDFLEVQPNTTYTYSGYDDTSVRKRVCMYSSNSEASFLQESSGTNATLTFTTTSTTKYIRFQFKTSEINNIQLEKGSKANTYTPYGTTPIELCKIGNYQDYFYKDSDKWYLHKEIGKVVLNGSESGWNYQNGCFTLYDIPNIIKTSAYADRNQILVMSDYFKAGLSDYRGAISATNYQIAKAIDSNGTQIAITFNDYTSISDFTTWLSSHNLTVYYVLLTPTNTALEDM